MSGVGVWRAAPEGGRITLLAGIDWQVRPGQRWAVVGANGAGKSTLLAIAGAERFPSDGRVDVLGARLGRVDLRQLRRRIGRVDASGAGAFAPRLTAEQVVLTGAQATIVHTPSQVTPFERERAAGLIGVMGLGRVVRRPFVHLSRGERQRVLLARAMMADPALLLLDEPTEGLDLPGREMLLDRLDALAAGHPDLAMVQVSHHLEDLPRGTDHALLLQGGRTVACGPVAQSLTEDTLSRCFGVPVRLAFLEGRVVGVVARGWSGP